MPDDEAREITPWQTWRNGVTTIERDALPDGPPVDLDLRPRNPEGEMSTPNRPDHTFAPESPAEAPEGDEDEDEPQEAPETPQEDVEGEPRPSPAG